MGSVAIGHVSSIGRDQQSAAGRAGLVRLYRVETVTRHTFADGHGFAACLTRQGAASRRQHRGETHSLTIVQKQTSVSDPQQSSVSDQ